MTELNEFLNSDDFRLEINTDKSNNEYVICKECNASFTSNYALIDHFKTHNIKLELVCIFCGRDYRDERDLVNHMLKHDDVIHQYNHLFLDRLSFIPTNILLLSERDNQIDITDEIKLEQVEDKEIDIKAEFVQVDVKDCNCVQLDCPKIELESDQLEMKLEYDALTRGYDTDQVDCDADETDNIPENNKDDDDSSDDNVPLQRQKENAIKMRINETVSECPRKVKKKRRPKRKTFKCDFCSFEAPNVPTVKQHMKYDCEQKFYSCTKCDFKSKSKDESRMHRNSHTSNGLYRCPECDFKTKNPPHYKSHRVMHQQKAFQCHLCDKAFRRKFNLKDHLQTHSNERRFRCTECPVAYKDPKSLKKHLLVIHDITYVHKKKEQPISSTKDENQFKCDTCDYSTNNTDSLQIHRRKHEGGWPHVCDQCEYKTKVLQLLKGHQITHTEKSIYCEYCGKAFRRFYNLKEHLRTHSDERLFRCNKCPKSYKEIKSLKNHLLQTHMDDKIKSFDCDQCEFKAVTKFRLQRHKRKHNPEHAFQCKECTYRCRSLATLKRHSLIHMDYPVASCPHCEFKSVSEAAVKKHLRVHKE